MISCHLIRDFPFNFIKGTPARFDTLFEALLYNSSPMRLSSANETTMKNLSIISKNMHLKSQALDCHFTPSTVLIPLLNRLLWFSLVMPCGTIFSPALSPYVYNGMIGNFRQ